MARVFLSHSSHESWADSVLRLSKNFSSLKENHLVDPPMNFKLWFEPDWPFTQRRVINENSMTGCLRRLRRETRCLIVAVGRKTQTHSLLRLSFCFAPTLFLILIVPIMH